MTLPPAIAGLFIEFDRTWLKSARRSSPSARESSGRQWALERDVPISVSQELFGAEGVGEGDQKIASIGVAPLVEY